jgi:hypothetical protein
MAGSNTNILIKRSLTTSAPSSLRQGELAYSYNSNTIFLGSPSGDGAIKIGGQYYTNKIDNATDAATPSTIVLRDATGNASFNYIFANIVGTITGTAAQSNKLTTARTFSISGGDISASGVSFDGTGNVTLNASLNNIAGLTAATYGSSTAIPVLDIAANGRITGVTTAAISSSFTVAGDSGSGTQNNGGTLTINGSSGITTTVTGSGNETVTISTDNTVVRSNTAITNQTIDGSVTIAGNLTVQGTQTITNTSTLNVADPLIYLAANNYTGDAVDIGFAANYYDGSTQRHTGVFRDSGTKEFYVFDNYAIELSSNNAIDVADASFRKANLNAGWVKSAGIISGGIDLNKYIQSAYDSGNTTYTLASNANANTVYLQGVNDTQNTRITSVNTFAQGAYDKANAAVYPTSTLSSGQLVVGNGSSNGVTSLANTTYTLTGALSAAKTITSLTVDAYGRVTAATGADIAIDASQITSGTLGVSRGGTGAGSFSSGQIVIGNGTGALQQLANVTAINASVTSGNTVASLVTDVYGRITSFTQQAISGLTVAQGGTGQNAFTTNGIIFGNSTSGLQVTAASGVSDQTWSNQILTVTNAGVPVWTSALDGGTF